MHEPRTPIVGISTIPWERLTPDDKGYLMIIGERAALAMRPLVDRLRTSQAQAGIDSTGILDPDSLLISMDVAAAHLARDCRLDLRALANFPDDLLLQDVVTIQRCIDRTTGALPFFVPLRCAKPARIY